LPQSLQCAGGTSFSAAVGDADAADPDGPGDDDAETTADADGVAEGTVVSQPAISAIATRAARPPLARRRRVIRSGGYPRALYPEAMTPRLGALTALVLGGIAVVAATVVGANADALEAIVHPPPLIRAALVGGSAAIAVILLSRGLARLAGGRDDVPGLIRGVRLVFLAVAAAAAGAGWALGDALPLIIALVIAGIDVVETSFLLLVVASGKVSGTD
jgi:hypothetical protein